MENTLENKAKFFAQYWGQEVVITDGILRVASVGTLKKAWVIQSHLELTAISSITDEDAIEVSNIVRDVTHGKSFDTRVDNIKQLAKYYAIDYSAVSDYLRSKGYALPLMRLSVEEQVNRGWIVLKTKKNESR
jgi:hypothetical protein